MEEEQQQQLARLHQFCELISQTNKTSGDSRTILAALPKGVEQQYNRRCTMLTSCNTSSVTQPRTDPAQLPWIPKQLNLRRPGHVPLDNILDRILTTATYSLSYLTSAYDTTHPPLSSPVPHSTGSPRLSSPHLLLNKPHHNHIHHNNNARPTTLLQEYCFMICFVNFSLVRTRVGLGR